MILCTGCVDIFCEDIVDNTNPSQTQYYNPQTNASYYSRHANLPLYPQSTYMPQDLNYQSQQTPTFTVPYHPQYTSSSHDITKESPSQVLTAPSSVTKTPISSVPPSSMETGPSEKKRKTADPSYNASWWRCSTFITPDEIQIILLLLVVTLCMNFNHPSSYYIIYSLILCSFFNRNRSNSSSGLLNELRENEYFEDQQMNNTKLLSYCLGSMEDDRIDILEYWRRNVTAYPTLAMMACDIFTMLVSTIPSKSCFSSTNRILIDKRTKLGSKLFKQLVCNKDWIDAENHI
jgi:hAT family C-terminal dimerisation region